MAIKITDVERIGEVAADPAFVANFGFLYTKDALGITQLFYETDAGTVYQLTPAATPGDTPWLRTGTTVALDQTGDLLVVPFDDNTTAFGSQTLRWLSAATGAVGYRTFSNVGPNPTSALASASLTFGTGGASAVDTGLSRFAVSVFALTDGGAGSASLIPNDDASGTLGTSSNRWANVNADSNGGGFRNYNALGDANVISALDQNLVFGAGGASAVDIRLSRTAASVLTLDDAAGGGIDVLPPTGGTGNFGTFATQWNSFVADGFFVVDNPGDANASAVVTGPGIIRLGAGGATALDIRLQRTAAAELTLDDNAGGNANLIPATDHGTNVGSSVGTAARRFAQVNAFEVNTGDVCFTDERCAVCNEFFEEGDDLVMRVIKIHHEPTGRRTRTVPAHHGCR